MFKNQMIDSNNVYEYFGCNLIMLMNEKVNYVNNYE